MRLLIREVLSEELASFRAAVSATQSQVNLETVALDSDADLDSFVRRILEMGQDATLRGDILDGRHQFRLAHKPMAISPALQPVANLPTRIAAGGTPEQTPDLPVQTRSRFTKGMITERDIDNLSTATATLSIGPGTRLTPLAQDEVRRRNIRLERTAT